MRHVNDKKHNNGSIIIDSEIRICSNKNEDYYLWEATMDYQFKKLINDYTDMIASAMIDADDSLNYEDMMDAVKFELAGFAMYLSCSDGEITWEEANFISDLLDLSLTAEGVKDLVEDLNIYSIEYETKAPPSLVIAVALDNLFFENGVSHDESPSDIAITIYKMIASAIINADGYEASSEINDYESYISMMLDYIHTNKLSNRASVQSPKKVTVKVGNKKGVKAPEKK